ncbi:hypothetical protein O181_048351 [Austropuccinia psidii MF-1]|uniref:SNF2 N-terminal domain-containing protein n=1 Tax=Austropuccinia psidii MF-1 TaxID=1389203 RepID=A0A9Q3DQK7_9BASI|nr:hypothetical protein [Austropuccinia psidii MF-1]
MSTFYSHISCFKLHATLISCSLFIDFREKTDTITQCIRPPHEDPAPFHYSNCPPPSSKDWTSPPGSTFNARHIITNKVISSFKSLLTNTPLEGLLAENMGLGKTIQAIVLIGTSKEQLITNPQCSTPTINICPPCLITNLPSEIPKHSQAGVLQAKIYHGPTCHSLCKADISKCDIIITSYNTITQELKQIHTLTLFISKINWHCIILDEAQ